MTLIQEIKQSSSKWIKTKSPEYAAFYWQDGYGIFSVSRSHVSKVSSYIARQKQYHQRQSFENEFRNLLSKYDVEYDERYVWD